ncbi:SLATT domain-containing protein [Halomonas cerina]|uniref:SLATT domain-containing protein n=1 Tax=Halomonas cerina TaxID=447424 RepID=A0A839V426_9GAMM|nr:SLATT domain-containing protein [Halomonas cerina]MBB3189911.1 hypothetical protein [Halomonas cerina]
MQHILEAVRREATDIEKEAMIAADAHFLAGWRWGKVHLMLGIPSTILAAVAGVSAFSELPAPLTAGVAMLVAALSALSTFLSPGDRAGAHRAASTTFSDIRRAASLLRDVDLPLVKEGDEAAARDLAGYLKELAQRITEAEQHAPPISATAKLKAEKRYRQQHMTGEEA